MFARFAVMCMIRQKETVTKAFRPEPRLKQSPTIGNAQSAALQRMCFSKKPEAGSSFVFLLISSTGNKIQLHLFFDSRLDSLAGSGNETYPWRLPYHSIPFSSYVHGCFHDEQLKNHAV